MKKELKEYINSDLFRYTTKISKKLFIKNLILNRGFKYMYIYRKCRFYNINKNKIKFYFYRIILEIYKRKFSYEISHNTEIGYGFYIGHLGPIIINPHAKIGNNVNISGGVVIGQQNRGKNKGYPIIGDMVFIGANSIIVGSIKIGNNVLIAPGSYVNFDVPDNSIVVGNPGKIKKDDNATYGYIGSILEENNKWKM